MHVEVIRCLSPVKRGAGAKLSRPSRPLYLLAASSPIHLPCPRAACPFCL